MKPIRLAWLFVFLVSASSVFAAMVTIPAGTPIHVTLRQTIRTETAKVGGSVAGRLTSALVVRGRTIAKAGSAVRGRISAVESSGRIGGSARLVWTLRSITLANGRQVAVRTSSYVREGRGHAKHNAAYIAGGAIAGALLGQAAGGDHNATEKGTAIGAGIGIGAAAATGKLDFTLSPGAHFTFKLRRAFTVSE